MSIRKFCSSVVSNLLTLIEEMGQFLLVLGSCLILSLLVMAGHPLMGLLVYSASMAGTCLYAHKHGGIRFWQALLGGFVSGLICQYMGMSQAMGYTITMIQIVSLPVVMIMYTLGAVLLSLNWKKLFEKAQVAAAGV